MGASRRDSKRAGHPLSVSAPAPVPPEGTREYPTISLDTVTKTVKAPYRDLGQGVLASARLVYRDEARSPCPLATETGEPCGDT